MTFYAEPRRFKYNPVSLLRKQEPGRDVTKRFDFVLREQALPLAAKCRADLLLVVRPDKCNERTEAALARYGRPVAAWIIDSLSRCPNQDCLSRYTVADFFIDGDDVKGKKAVWLPLGVDETLVGDESRGKDVDVLFVGNLERPLYSERRRCFEALMKSSIPARYKCAAIVRGGGRVADEWLRWRAKAPVSRPVSIGEYVARIASARVCVNVLQSDGVSPVNDTFSLIPAVLTCELVDRRDYLARWLEPERHFATFAEGAVIPELEALLSDRRRSAQIALEGRAEVLARHTYTNRARSILASAGLTAGR